MRLAILAVLAFVALAAAPARAADWSTYRYPELGFTAVYPGAPTRLNKPTQSSGGSIPTEFVYVKDNEVLYFISSSDVSSQAEAMTAPDSASRGILDGAMQTGTTVAAPTHLPVPNAWEGTTTTAEGQLIRVRTYVRGKHGFTIMVIAPVGHSDRVNDAAASRFFGAFAPDGG